MADSLTATLLSCGYRLESSLGQGGMGVVYRATQLSLDRTVAVKTLLPDKADSLALRRFRREAHALRSIDHPNVVRVLDISPSDDPAFIVLEYIPGATSLSEAWDRLPTDLPSRIQLVRALAEGLAAAHAVDMVHRDLKPGNILLGPDAPKIIDFGLARTLSADETRHTQDGQILGTLAYMAPEQLRGEEIGLPSDVYAFALLATEILARRPIFGSIPRPVVSYAERLQRGLPDLRTWCSEAPPALALLLGRALAADPKDRPSSAQALLKAWPNEASVPDTGAVTLAGAPPVELEPQPPPARPNKRERTVQLQAAVGPPATRSTSSWALVVGLSFALAVVTGTRMSCRAGRVPRVDSAVPSFAVSPDAQPEVVVSGRNRNLVVAVSSQRPLDLRVAWTARGEPRELVLSASTTHKVDVPMDGYSDDFGIELGGRKIAVEPLLASRLKRLAAVLRPFELDTCLRRLRGLSRRRQAATQEEVSALVPDGIRDALGSLGPALGVGLQTCTDPVVRRELLSKVSELELLDARLAALRMPVCTRVSLSLPASWSELTLSPESPQLPTRHLPTQQTGSMRTSCRVNGLFPKYEWFASGPGWEWLNFGCGVFFPPAAGSWEPCRIEWFQPQRSNVSYRTALCMVESISRNSCGVRLEINDKLNLAFSLVASSQQVNANGAATSWRLIPSDILTKGLNRIKLTPIPYPDSATQPDLFVSSITLIGYAGEPPQIVHR